MAERNGEMIRMREIRKVYATGRVEVEALRGIDLDIARNEYVAVVGPSGSGKSTLMNLLGCLDTPSSGEYVLSGEAVAGLDRNRSSTWSAGRWAGMIGAIRIGDLWILSSNGCRIPRLSIVTSG